MSTPVRDVFGVDYPSIVACGIKHKIHPRILQNRLNKWYFPFSWIFPKSRGSKPRPITYEGRDYPSLTACAKAEDISISGAHLYANAMDAARAKIIAQIKNRKK